MDKSFLHGIAGKPAAEWPAARKLWLGQAYEFRRNILDFEICWLGQILWRGLNWHSERCEGFTDNASFADRYYCGARRRKIFFSRGVHVVGCGRRNLLSVDADFFRRQTFHPKSGECAGDGGPALQADGLDADKEALGLTKLIGRGAGGDEAIELVSDFVNGSGSDRVANVGVTYESASGTVSIHRCVRRIGVTLFLANIRRESRAERAAVNGIGNHGGFEIRIAAQGTGGGKLNGCLDRAGTFDDEHSVGRIGSETRSLGDGRFRRGLPGSEIRFDKLEHFLILKITDGDEDRLVRAKALRVYLA